MSETEFLKHLREEILATEEARANYTLRKLAYATALLGVGSLSTGTLDLSSLLYLVPFVALAFDLYILAEDYSIKRIGAFLASNSTDALEQHWENWIARNRDWFAPIAMPLLTILLTAGAALVIRFQNPNPGLHYWVWMVVAVASTGALSMRYWFLRRSTLRRAKTALATHSPPFVPLERLRSAVGSADHVISQAVFERSRDLFNACSSRLQDLQELQRLASEYGQPEFLLCVDRNGLPVYPTQDILEDFVKIVNQQPDFGLWFREATVDEDGRPILLIARWLCHLVGFRHRSVHLFIDHPTVEGYTLVQVRGLNKFESPGLFDLPVAGHVVGLESAMDTLFKELKEELGWTGDHILDPQMVDSYNYSEPLSDPAFRNVEFRLVFRTRLRTNQLAKARFVDGEVAAVSVFALPELRSLLHTFPEKVASGLLESFPLYAKNKAVMS